MSEFFAKHDTTVTAQLDLAIETLKFQMKIMQSFKKIDPLDRLELQEKFSKLMKEQDDEQLQEQQEQATKDS